MTRLPGTGWLVSGFAFVPASRRAADAVLICRAEGNRWRIQAIADPVMPSGRPRFNLDYEFTSYHQPGYRPLPRWESVLPEEVAADPLARWSAWVLDARKWRVARIPGEIRFVETSQD